MVPNDSPVTVTGAAPASTVSQFPIASPVTLAKVKVCAVRLPVMAPLDMLVFIHDAVAGHDSPVKFPNISSCGGVCAKHACRGRHSAARNRTSAIMLKRFLI